MASKANGKCFISIAELERQALDLGKEHGKNSLQQTLQDWIDKVNWPKQMSEMDGGYILKDRRQTKIDTTVGKITLKGPYYWKSGAEPLHVLPAFFGLSGRTSPELARLMGLLAAELPFTLCKEQLKSVLNLDVSHMNIRSHALELGKAALEQQTEAQLPKDFGDPLRMTVEIDGGRINTEEGWREPRLARIEVENEKGDQIVFGLSRIVTAVEFWALLMPLLQTLKIASTKFVAFLGDGAPWILGEAKKLFPEALCVLDFYHAAEHIHDAAKLMFANDEQARTWARKWTKPLKRGRFEYVLQGLRRQRPRLRSRGFAVSPLDGLLDYLEPRRNQLRYATARRRGFRIGSGRIEALIKQAVNLRLKRNGAWWNVANAEAILALRLAKLTGHYELVHARELKLKHNSAPRQFWSLLRAHPLPQTLIPSSSETLAG